MYQGKHSAQPAGRARRGASPAHDVTPSRRRSARRHGGRPLALLLALILVVGAAAGGTVAWLTQTTETANNNFSYGTVSCAINESFNGTTKSAVSVKNTGNTPAYIRATYVVNWLDKNGNIAASVPEGYSYSLTENPDGKWTKRDDGYFYYLTPVAPQESTLGSLLTCTVTRLENPEYQLSVEILATAIQSAPASAVTEAWGVTPTSGN